MTNFEDTLFIDTETTGTNILGNDTIFGVSYAIGSEQPEYIDIRKDSQEGLIKRLTDAKTVVAHGTKFDAHSLQQLNINLLDKDLDCTLIREQLIDEHKFKYDLGSLTGQKDDIIGELAGIFGGPVTKNVQMGNLHKAPYELVSKYARQDIVALRDLFITQVGRLPHVHYLEKEVLKVLIRMERLGIRVDESKIDSTIATVKRKIEKAQYLLEQAVGHKINVNSSPQMQELFQPKENKDGSFTLIDGTIASRTKAGKASIDQDTLLMMQHPAAELVLKVRKYAKIHDTFLISQLQGKMTRGRVHPNYNQCRVVTGRLSCSDPNLQAIPKRDPEMKAILRPLFLPEPDHLMLRCDYEQSDMRGFAHYMGEIWKKKTEHPVIAAYQEDPLTDFHTMVSELLDIPRNPHVNGGANAKQINLAMVFNMGTGRLAKEMGLPYTTKTSRKGKKWLKPGPEAVKVFNRYNERIPGASDMQEAASDTAIAKGHVVSILGRHLRFPNKHFSYKASGYLYQAFTAELIKKAMVDTVDIASLHLSVHDELIFSVSDEQQIKEIRDAMNSALNGEVKIPVRTLPEIGPNWGETKLYNGGE